jgi:predicted acyltransferase
MDTEREELTSRRERLVSLDVLRGFDMFWIIGGKKIIVAISLLTSAQWVDWTLARMEHPEWNGFEPWDLIFPLFLFIAGVATPLAINHRRRRGDNDRKIYCHILLRGALLVALGIIYNGLPTDWTDSTGWQNHRYPSVLGRIGLAYMFAAIIVMRTELLGRLLWVVGLLLGYWAALRFIPVPEFGAGDWSPGHTLTDYLDRLMVPGTLSHGVFRCNHRADADAVRSKWNSENVENDFRRCDLSRAWLGLGSGIRSSISDQQEPLVQLVCALLCGLEFVVVGVVLLGD